MAVGSVAVKYALPVVLLASFIGLGFLEKGPARRAAVAESGRFHADPVRYFGLALEIHSSDPNIDYLKYIREIADTGANTICFVLSGYQENGASTSIWIDHRKIPESAKIEQYFQTARNLGLRTILMPVVLLQRPVGNEWRGMIKPADQSNVNGWDAWFGSYFEFISYFADLGQRCDADVLMIGSELVSSESKRKQWMRIIKRVRWLYSGQIGYSANWDHYRSIPFWSDLDLMGMTSYYTLSEGKDPTVEEMTTRWQSIKRGILDWQKILNKPIVFTEVGWCSQQGAASAPWNYYQSKEVDLEEQRACYESFLKVWADVPEIAGLLFWKWATNDGGPEDIGYTPKNKPAEQELRHFFAERGRQTENE